METENCLGQQVVGHCTEFLKKIHSDVTFSTRIITALHLMNIWYLLRVIPFLLSQVQSFLRSFSTLGLRVCLSVCVHADAIFSKFVIFVIVRTSLQDVCGTGSPKGPASYWLPEKLKIIPTDPLSVPGHGVSRSVGGGQTIISPPATFGSMAYHWTPALHDEERNPGSNASSFQRYEERVRRHLPSQHPWREAWIGHLL